MSVGRDPITGNSWRRRTSLLNRIIRRSYRDNSSKKLAPKKCNRKRPKNKNTLKRRMNSKTHLKNRKVR